ncbi:hypothetical protein CBS115989_7752 [Aspergillus niger]|uniref:Cell division protein anillin family protein n=2 Tax=Aspergillus niger TaxID=5061 RepID=A0A254U7U8_ASPNG|nr:hypothetical protein CBS115989_7752 [Aspergillus niger]RDH18023.1 hypothetical protein M747DRAFT_307606 [Aspergillus niger ATCC 13496]KAI2862256.1 hypothetical protein CBS11232_477 [Aspergillus niger]KAI2882116.1 hypothetical protein CBS115988_43 [Aspergillus niger]KAI2892286.1 hypothetical protein CBS11852_5902 [Aspergillus niger]
MSSFHANLSSQTAEFFRHSSEPSQINLAEKNVTSQGAGQGDNSKSLDEPTTLSSQGYEPTADEDSEAIVWTSVGNSGGLPALDTNSSARYRCRIQWLRLTCLILEMSTLGHDTDVDDESTV